MRPRELSIRQSLPSPPSRGRLSVSSPMPRVAELSPGPNALCFEQIKNRHTISQDVTEEKNSVKRKLIAITEPPRDCKLVRFERRSALMMRNNRNHETDTIKAQPSPYPNISPSDGTPVEKMLKPPSRSLTSGHTQQRMMATGDCTSPASPAASATNNPSGSWSAVDDEILLRARAQSQGWSQIQRHHFPSKTANACRKRYERLVARRRRTDWTDARVNIVINQYRMWREQIWRPIADAIGEHWEDVEKLCLERGTGSMLLPSGLRDTQRAGSEHSSRTSPDSHDDEIVSIKNLIQ